MTGTRRGQKPTDTAEKKTPDNVPITDWMTAFRKPYEENDCRHSPVEMCVLGKVGDSKDYLDYVSASEHSARYHRTSRHTETRKRGGYV